jgi:F0F1-type ATP synthase assembly protein I
MDEDKKSNRYSKVYQDIGPYLGLGFQLAATIGVMVFLGYWLDSKFNTKPLLIIICALFGVFAGMYNFLKTVLNINKKKKDE